MSVFGFFVCSPFLLIRNFMVIKNSLYWSYRSLYEWVINNSPKEVSTGMKCLVLFAKGSNSIPFFDLWNFLSQRKVTIFFFLKLIVFRSFNILHINTIVNIHIIDVCWNIWLYSMKLVILFVKFWLFLLCVRVCAVSRCYRAEVSRLEEEQGIYRVHQFTKV